MDDLSMKLLHSQAFPPDQRKIGGMKLSKVTPWFFPAKTEVVVSSILRS